MREAMCSHKRDRRVTALTRIGERSDAVLQTAMPGDDSGGCCVSCAPSARRGLTAEFAAPPWVSIALDPRALDHRLPLHQFGRDVVVERVRPEARDHEAARLQ